MQSIVATDADLRTLVRREIKRLGTHADLNHIDVSLVTNMYELFRNKPFNGNISQWNVSNVTDITGIFYKSSFNGDISAWNIRYPKCSAYAFAESAFEGDISQWLFGSDVRDIGLSHQLFPRVEENVVEEYKYTLRRMYKEYSIRTVLTRILPMLSKTTEPCYQHAVAMILYPDTELSRIHSRLTPNDRTNVQILFNTTNSVHQAATLWEQMRRQQPSLASIPDLNLLM